MKYFIYIVLTLFILESCSNNKSAISEGNQNDSLKQNFNDIFKGTWVLTEYINSIDKTRSPLLSSNELEGIVTMVIDKANQSDSTTVGASWNNHEGYSFVLFFYTGQNKNSLKTNIPDHDSKTNFYELGYEVINKEVHLFLYHYTNANRLIDKRQFTKVAEEQPDNDDVAWGLQYIVNKKLFSGNYTFIDSSNSTNAVGFKKDGSLTGNTELKTYYVFTDFAGGPATVLDQIAFNLETPNARYLAFKHIKDTILLYTTTGDEEAGEQLQLDKIQYRLVKK